MNSITWPRQFSWQLIDEIAWDRAMALRSYIATPIFKEMKQDALDQFKKWCHTHLTSHLQAHYLEVHQEITTDAERHDKMIEELIEKYDGMDGVWFRVADANRNQTEETSMDYPLCWDDIVMDTTHNRLAFKDWAGYDCVIVDGHPTYIEDLTEQQERQLTEEYLSEHMPHHQFLKYGPQGEGLYLNEGLVFASRSLPELIDYFLSRGGFPEGAAIYAIHGTYIDEAGAGDGDIVEVDSYEKLYLIPILEV